MEQKEASCMCSAQTDVGDYETWAASATEVKVIIVGGGVAGLKAAKILLENNITDILILEADHRIGGRVLTHRQGDISVEVGAEWIHGEETSLFKIAKMLDEVSPVLSDDLEWDERTQTNNGHPSDPSKYEIVEDLMVDADDNGILKPYYHTGYGQFYIDRFPESYGKGWDSTLGQAWLHFLEKKVNMEEGTNNWLDISARDADQYVAKGEDHHWKSGTDNIVKHLKSFIPDDAIKVSSPVSKIIWDGHSHDNNKDRKVLIVANSGRASFWARHVIVTCSVGHLKEKHKELFQPALPATFVRNLNSIDLGVADKIQIGWEEPWWGSDQPLSLAILWTDRNLPKDMKWLYGISEIYSIHLQPRVLQAFVTGEDAIRMEELPKETVKRHLIHLLNTSMKLQVPEPTFFARSQWGLNPWTRGSYSSYITLEGDRAGLKRRSTLATPLVNAQGEQVILWAGEHTHNSRYGTVDGAMETGKREALTLIKILNKKSKLLNNNHSVKT